MLGWVCSLSSTIFTMNSLRSDYIGFRFNRKELEEIMFYLPDDCKTAKIIQKEIDSLRRRGVWDKLDGS